MIPIIAICKLYILYVASTSCTSWFPHTLKTPAANEYTRHGGVSVRLTASSEFSITKCIALPGRAESCSESARPLSALFIPPNKEHYACSGNNCHYIQQQKRSVVAGFRQVGIKIVRRDPVIQIHNRLIQNNQVSIHGIAADTRLAKRIGRAAISACGLNLRMTGGVAALITYHSSLRGPQTALPLALAAPVAPLAPLIYKSFINPAYTIL